MLGQIINGLAAGGGYALAAVGLSYTIGISRVMNFAYGTFYMLGAFLVAWLLGSALGAGYVVAVLLALVGIAVLGYGFARIAVLPVIEVSENAVMIATLASSIALTNVALLLFGGQVSFIASPFADRAYEIGGASLSQQAIIAFVAAPLVTAAIIAFMRRTTAGTRIRATAQNPALAAATGVDTIRVYLVAVIIGVVLAALAGALYGPVSIISVFSGDQMLLKAFTVAALAGMGQLWGAVVVGVGMGLAQSLFSAYVSAAYAPAFIYAVLIVALLFFPRGIFRGD
jgi:branched-chain amino acid transport system permease protein